MSVPEAKRLKAFESKNVRLRKLLEKSLLESELMKEALRKTW
jgi:hypothetical protein